MLFKCVINSYSSDRKLILQLSKQMRYRIRIEEVICSLIFEEAMVIFTIYICGLIVIVLFDPRF